MSQVTTTEIPSVPHRILEILLLAFPVVVGVGGLLLSLSSTFAFARTGAGFLFLGLFVAGLLSAVVVPVLLYLDARTVSAEGLDWTPNPLLYAVGGFLLSGLVVLHYLYVRAEHVLGSERRSGWWLLALGALLLPVSLLVVETTVSLAPLTGGAVPLGGLAGLVALVVFPIALYKDAAYVRSHGSWRPNPVMQFTLAIISLFLLVPLPFYLGYYLYKRHGAF